MRSLAGLVTLTVGMLIGAWLKGVCAPGTTPPPVPAAAVVKARAEFASRPDDWDTVCRYLQALSWERDALRNRLTDQGDRPAPLDLLTPTLEQQVLLERLEFLAHNPAQEQRLALLRDYVLNGPHGERSTL